MNLLDLSGPLQAFASASRRHSASGPPLYELIVASAEGGLVSSSAGLAVMTVPVASLEGCAIDTLQVEVDEDKIYVQDGRLWSSAGVSAGIDLALALIEDDYGHRIAIETARQMVVFMKRAGGQSQFSAPLSAQAREGGRFADLHAWMAANLHGDLCVGRLAEQAGMGTRTFARTYAAQTGATPAAMVETMRLEAARRALEDSSQPIKAIAAATGHGSEQNLRRVFLRRLGTSPGEYRKRFSAASIPTLSSDA
jgi:transcriptional regulator GlxA family with amidase domain